MYAVQELGLDELREAARPTSSAMSRSSMGSSSSPITAEIGAPGVGVCVRV